MKLDVTPINPDENDPFANVDFLGRTPDNIIAPKSSLHRKSRKAQ